MTVGELISILSKFDENCEVIVSLPHPKQDDPVLRYCGITRKVIGVDGCAEMDTNKWMAMLLIAENEE